MSTQLKSHENFQVITHKLSYHFSVLTRFPQPFHKNQPSIVNLIINTAKKDMIFKIILIFQGDSVDVLYESIYGL